MSQDYREKILDVIRVNIEKNGRHIYSLMGPESPRYLYTIGLYEKRGFELIFPGMATLPPIHCAQLLNQLGELLEQGEEPKSLSMPYEAGMTFHLSPVHSSWVKKLMAGALHYYGKDDMKAWQVVPDEKHGTIDIPNMTFPYSTQTNPVWRWLDGEWPYSVPLDSVVIVDRPVMLGEPVAQVLRREETEWDMLSASDEDLSVDNLFMVPLSTMLGFDPTLEPCLELSPGTGLIRKQVGGPWRRWVPRPEPE